MCQACDKKWGHYWENQATKEYLEALSHNIGIPILSLVESRKGKGGGTYVHRRVALHLAQWLSPEFAVQVTEWVEELLTRGRVELQPESNDEITRRIVREEMDRLRAAIVAPMQAVPIAVPVSRPVKLVSPREYVLRCWPDVSEGTLRLIVRRMDALYRLRLGRSAPQEYDLESAPLMCEADQLPLLHESLAYFWKKRHPPIQPTFEF